MKIIDTIKTIAKQHLPSLREPSPDYGYQEYMRNYGWVYTQGNKNLGNFSTYYLAEQNVWVTRSINSIIEGMINNGFIIETPKNETPNPSRVKYLEAVFNSPEGASSETTFYHLFRQVIHSYLLTGDAFLQINKDKKYNVVTGFTFVPADLLRWDNHTMRWCFREKPDIQYEPDELIHIFNPGIHLKTQKWGVSVLDCIREPLQLINRGLEHNIEIIDNDGLNPSTILSFDKDISDVSFNAELQRLSTLSQTEKNGGTLAIKGATFSNVAQSNKDLDFLELLKFGRDMIVSAYGVPPSKVGIIETSNLGNGSGESQDKTFRDVLSAYSTIIEVSINKALRESGFRERFRFNLPDIEDKLRRAQIEQIQIQSGVVTVNEVRDGYNLTPVEWGNYPLQQNQLNTMSDWNSEDMMSFKRYKNNVYRANLLSEWRKG